LQRRHFEVLQDITHSLQQVGERLRKANVLDSRHKSIALTHVETGILWLLKFQEEVEIEEDEI
jgi:hypothetical protein